MRRTTLIVAGIVLALLLWGRNSNEPETLGASTSAALFGVVTLFWWAGILLSTARGRSLGMLFWFCLMGIVAVASISQFLLVFGQPMSRYLTLLERHLFAMATIGLLGIILTTASPDKLLDRVRRFVGFSWAKFQLPAHTLIALGVVILAAFLVTSVLHAPLIGPTQTLYIFPAVLIGLAVLLWPLSRLFKSLKSQIRLSSILLVVPGLALAAVVFVTPEGGILGLQPSEAAKTGLTVYFALFIARFVNGNLWRLPFEPVENFVGWLIMFLILSGSFIVGSAINFDMSPAAIILATTSVMVIGLGVAYAFRMWPIPISFVLFMLIAVVTAFTTEADLIAKAIFIGLAAVVMALLTQSIPRRVNAPFTPEGLRKSRNFMPSFRRRFEIWKTRHNGVYLLLTCTAMGGITIVSVWAIVHISKHGTIDQLSDYSFHIAGLLPLPETPLERILSYRDAVLPAQGTSLIETLAYPDLSLQVRESREIIAASGCYFGSQTVEPQAAPQWAFDVAQSFIRTMQLCRAETGITHAADTTLFPISGMSHAAILDLPEVQDDFAATAVLALVGVDFGLALMLAQTIFVIVVLAITLQLALLMGRQLAFRGAALFSLVFMVGQLLVFICQVVLSWGNVFGLLPVVGQPMTFVSFGASHHLFFALPLCISVLLACAIVEALSRSEQNSRRNTLGVGVRRLLLLP